MRAALGKFFAADIDVIWIDGPGMGYRLDNTILSTREMEAVVNECKRLATDFQGVVQANGLDGAVMTKGSKASN